MNISEIPKGTKILVPCSQCGYKRSLTFQCKATYEQQKKRTCNSCRATNNDSGYLGHTRNHRKSGIPEGCEWRDS